MKDIINWLREIEHLANQVYLQAAAIYENDVKLKKFLDRTDEDEAWRYHVMGSAAEYMSSKQCEGDKTWQRKDTRSNRNALNADVALYAI
jgi:hypothetical protein